MFRVLWSLAAAEELARIWLSSDSATRAELTSAAHRLDQVLRSDPVSVGESRGGGDRILFEVPLAVTYDVDAVRRIVRVLQVWRFRSRR